VIIIEESGDTVIVGLGSKGISIVEDDKGGAEIHVFDMVKKRNPAPITTRSAGSSRAMPGWK